MVLTVKSLVSIGLVSIGLMMLGAVVVAWADAITT